MKQKISIRAALVCTLVQLSASAQTGAAESDTAKTLPFKYTGNLYSHKFHRPRCPFCRSMAAPKRRPFHFRYQAIAAGYAPCKYCLPQRWTTVRAAILINPENPDELKDSNLPLGESPRETDICRP